LAYVGGKAKLYDLLFNFKHSIILQSLRATEGAEATNGDGFGVGWYPEHIKTNSDDGEEDNDVAEEYDGLPLLFRSVEPAWHDRNLKEIAQGIHSHTVFAHVRAASPSVANVQQTNCHPYRYENWLFMHNGVIRGFKTIKRDLILRIDPELFPFIEGSTDSETFFYLALTFGLKEDPPAAMAKAVGYITTLAKKAGVEFPVQMTVATTDGTRLWAFRYSTEGKSRTLYYSSNLEDILAQYEPQSMAHKRMSILNIKQEQKRRQSLSKSLARLKSFTGDSRFVVSEPLGGLPGMWNMVPESSCVFIEDGMLDVSDFVPDFDAV
jgi:predicted glutamine amidotransferase